MISQIKLSTGSLFRDNFFLKNYQIESNMVLHWKSQSRRRLTLLKRDLLGLNARERVSLKESEKKITSLAELLIKVKSKILKMTVALILMNEILSVMKICIVDVPDKPIKFKIPRMNFELMSNHLHNQRLTWSERFRFQSVEQMRRILLSFNLPTGIVKVKTYSFTSEEILLISLTRLSYPLRWSDMYERFAGRKRWELSTAFYWFIAFMIGNWSYLLLNNLNYWKDFLLQSAESIRLKLANLAFEGWRQIHPSAFQPFGFDICAFIDNTMFAFCRPGGCTCDGESAPRVPKEVQEAWWTGWKKLHGMKWQTLILSNGMDLHVWGPLSVRQNDLTTLARSEIEEKVRELQADVPPGLKKKVYGDSAYFNSDVLCIGEGRGMSSVRESIEHSYKDVKAQWKICDWEIAMKLRGQPVAHIMFVCLMLRNIYVTLNGSQVSEYFNLNPPTLEEWTAQGLRAHPIPSDSIFSTEYDNDNNLFEVEDIDDDIEYLQNTNVFESEADDTYY